MQDRTALIMTIAVVACVAAAEFLLLIRYTRVPVSRRRWMVVGVAVAAEVIVVSALLVVFPRPEDYVRAMALCCAAQGLLAVSGMGVWMILYRG